MKNTLSEALEKLTRFRRRHYRSLAEAQWAPLMWNPVEWNTNGLDAGLSVHEHLSHLLMGQVAGSNSNPWLVSLKNTNIVVGGFRGRSFLGALVGHLAPHPHVEVDVICTPFTDPHFGIDASQWRARLSVTKTDQARDVVVRIDRMLHDCLQRLGRMRMENVRNAWEAPGFLGADEPVRVLIVEESSVLFRTDGERVAELVRAAKSDLLALMEIGPAAGYVVVVATVSPNVRSLPPPLLDQGPPLRVAWGLDGPSEFAAILGEDIDWGRYELPDCNSSKAVVLTERNEPLLVQCAVMKAKPLQLVPNPSRSQWTFHRRPRKANNSSDQMSMTLPPVKWTANWRTVDHYVGDYLSRLPMGQQLAGPTNPWLAGSAQPWFLSLSDTNVVVFDSPVGEAFVRGLVGHLALHPHVEIGMIDLQDGIEAHLWHARLSASATLSHCPSDLLAKDVIAGLLTDCLARRERMRVAQVSNAWSVPRYFDTNEPVKVLIIKDCERLFEDGRPGGTGSRTSSSATESVVADLKQLMALGPAAGYVVVLSTTYPSVSALPPDLLEHARTRVASARATRFHTELVLGEGMYTDCIDAAREHLPAGIEHEMCLDFVVAGLRKPILVQRAVISHRLSRDLSFSDWSGNKWSNHTNTEGVGDQSETALGGEV